MKKDSVSDGCMPIYHPSETSEVREFLGGALVVALYLAYLASFIAIFFLVGSTYGLDLGFCCSFLYGLIALGVLTLFS